MVKSGFWRTSTMFLIGFLALSNANIRAQETETLEALVQRLEKLSLNNRKEAFELSKIAISRAENELGKEHPTTLGVIGEIVGVYTMEGYCSDALPLALRLLELRERTLGGNAELTLSAVLDLASVYRCLERNDLAEPLFVRGYEGRRQLLGDEHKDTNTARLMLGVYYQQVTTRKDEAEKLIKHSIETAEKIWGDDGGISIFYSGYIIKLYEEQGRTNDALEFAKKRFRYYRKRYNPDSSIVLSEQGKLFLLQHRYSEAEDVVKRAFTQSEKEYGLDHKFTQSYAVSLGEVYVAQGQYQKALPYFILAFNNSYRKLGIEHYFTRRIARELADLYRRMAQPANADAVMQRISLHTSKFVSAPNK